TEGDRSFRRWPVSLLQPTWSFVTCTYPNRASKISSFITPEGACANECQDLPGDAHARCPRCAAQHRPAAAADFPAATHVRLHFWTRDGRERIPPTVIQEPAASGDYGDQHDRNGHLGRGHAPDFRISIYPGDRGPASRSDEHLVACHREGSLRNAPGVG